MLIDVNKHIYTSWSHQQVHTSAFHKHKEQPIKPVRHNSASQSYQESLFTSLSTSLKSGS